MRIRKSAILFVAALSVAALMNGCSSDTKEGGAAAFPAKVSDSKCIQCHSAVVESLTGESIITQYLNSSPHNTAKLGCEACHGSGAMHNGVGPIPYPQPTAARCATCHNGKTAPITNSNTAFETSNHVEGTPSHTSGLCIRCHTHEGAVLSDKSGFTGELASGALSPGVLDNPAYGPPVWANGFTAFKCETCHEHGGGLRTVSGRDTSGNIVLWNPSKSGVADQINLCTSCHNLYNYNGNLVIASGSVASNTLTYEHNNRWYRTLATTHKEKGMTSVALPFNNMTSDAVAGTATIDGVAGKAVVSRNNTRITGYVLRKTNTNNDPFYRGPCFDCHGHEAKTNTSNTANDPASATIYTDWARSPHAGGILAQKIAATGGDRTKVDLAMTGYVTAATGDGWIHYNWDSTYYKESTTNDVERGSCQKCHTATGISSYLPNQENYDFTKNNFSHLLGWSPNGGSARQNELLYCWGCHSNAATGALRNTDYAILDFTYGGKPIVISGIGKSVACTVCHGGRGNVETPRSSRFQGHHAPTAGVLFSEKTHIGYEYAGRNYKNPDFFAHDKIGRNASGPCASCHMGGKSHTFEAVDVDGTGAITAIRNQALCNTCHTVGGPYEMTPAKLEEEKAGYKEASDLLNKYVSNAAGFTNYLNLAITSSNYNNTTLVPDNAYGAFQNGKINGDEPCAYVHNRFYVKRLIYDSIDFMDDGILNFSVSFDPVAFPKAAAWFGSGTPSRP